MKVIKDNVSPRFLKDFGVVGKKSATSRGYPYDYESVMHYGEKYFTINGKPTLEVNIYLMMKPCISERKLLDCSLSQAL